MNPSTNNQDTSDQTSTTSYIQNEMWFEVNRYYPRFDQTGEQIGDSETRKYILVINSYGKLRKLFTEKGGYEDVN